MSDAEKHLLIGQLVSDYAKIRQERELLKAKAHGIGMTMETIGRSMQKYAFSDASFHLKSSSHQFSEAREVLAQIDELEANGKVLRDQLNAAGIKQDY
jgi:hypothetical protein